MTPSRPLRLVVPAWTMVPGGMGGSETYARSLLDELATRPDLEVTTLVNREGAGQLASAAEVVAEGVRGGTSTTQRLRTVARGLVPGAGTRRVLRSADVVHHPFTVPVPGTRRRPRVQTLLDVQHHDLPELFSRAERTYRAAAYDATARRADRVITISEFSRRRIVERLGIPEERVTVAHLGVDADAFEQASGPRDDYVYYPARYWPHKNHARLLAAMEIVRRTRPDLRLVLTGGSADALGALPDWVEHRGQVPGVELRRLYARATCLAFPSLYEGFGLPPLEAMASGCPVAAADAGSVPEVCGDAAVLFDPLDVAAIARGIENAIDSRDRLVPRGLERVRELTWGRCADVHVEAYRDCLTTL